MPKLRLLKVRIKHNHKPYHTFQMKSNRKEALHRLIPSSTTMNITEYTIELRDVHLFAHHGVMPQEREIGAWFTIDIKLGISDYSCTISDNIDGTVSYADVYEIITLEMNKPSKLLENVCSRISESIYRRFTTVSWISVTLCKDTPPMGGDRLKAAVTLNSKRQEAI